MTHFEKELEKLKDSLVEMMDLVRKQLVKSREAFLNKDEDLAAEVIHNESRVNGAELSIDRDCENYFALFNPVATDLRLVLAILKINSHLERIGDHADGIAKYAMELDNSFNETQIEAIRFNEMFDLALSMFDDVQEAFVNKDAAAARRVFKKDGVLNEINSDASNIIMQIVKGKPKALKNALFLFTTIRKLERIGDLSKNIAEEIIFYLEAEILKHQKNFPA